MGLDKRVSIESLDFVRVSSMPNLSNKYENRQEDMDVVVYSREHQSSGREIMRTANVGCFSRQPSLPRKLAMGACLKISGR
jgi:hypothetical protein